MGYNHEKSLEKADLTTQILEKFEKSDRFLHFSKPIIDGKQSHVSHKLSEKELQEMHETSEIKRLGLAPTPKANLIVLIGESGIGKTTSVAKYSKILREQGQPVYYLSVDKTDKKTLTKSSFLMRAFGTDDIEQICDVIYKNYTLKGKKATLIIDNIHYLQNNGVLCSSILTTINNQFFQGLNMNVIMVSSVNDFAYRMDDGKIFFFMVLLNINYKKRIRFQ